MINFHKRITIQNTKQFKHFASFPILSQKSKVNTRINRINCTRMGKKRRFRDSWNARRVRGSQSSSHHPSKDSQPSSFVPSPSLSPRPLTTHSLACHWHSSSHPRAAVIPSTIRSIFSLESTYPSPFFFECRSFPPTICTSNQPVVVGVAFPVTLSFL